MFGPDKRTDGRLPKKYGQKILRVDTYYVNHERRSTRVFWRGRARVTAGKGRGKREKRKMAEDRVDINGKGKERAQGDGGGNEKGRIKDTNHSTEARGLRTDRRHAGTSSTALTFPPIHDRACCTIKKLNSIN